MAAAVLATLVLTLLIASPFALVAFGTFTDDEWSKAGNIGQAYGAVSAVISGIAVIGVAYSLQHQAQQHKLQQMRCVQSNQLELMKIYLEHPHLFGAPASESHLSEVARQQEIYINLLFKHLDIGYETGYIPEGALSAHLARQFSRKHVRDWWSRSLKMYQLEANTSRRRRFFHLAMAEFDRWRRLDELERWSQRDPSLLAVERGWEKLDSHHRTEASERRRKPFVAPALAIIDATIPLMTSRHLRGGGGRSLRRPRRP